MVAGRKVNTCIDDRAVILEAFAGFIDALVRSSLGRIEAEREQNGGTGPACLSTADAVEYMAVSERTLRRLKDRGEIKTVSVGGCVRYTRKSLDAYLRREEKGA